MSDSPLSPEVAKPSASAPLLLRSGSLSLAQRLEMAKTETAKFSLADLDLGPRARADDDVVDPPEDPQAANEKVFSG